MSYFSKSNMFRREGQDAMVLIISHSIYLFLNKAFMPWTKFFVKFLRRRQKILVLRIVSFPILHFLKIYFPLYHFVHIQSSLHRE